VTVRILRVAAPEIDDPK